MLPRRLPFSSLLKALLKKVRRVAELGDILYGDGLMLMSSSAFLMVVGELGDIIPAKLSCGGCPPSSCVSEFCMAELFARGKARKQRLEITLIDEEAEVLTVSTYSC